MVYECGDLLAETERFPDGAAAHRSPTSTSTGSARSGCGRAPSTTTGGRYADRVAEFRTVEFELRPARAATSGCAARSTASRSCPTTPQRLALDCYEAYNIQVSGLEQRLHAIGQPKVVIGVSGGLDSTHALIVAAKAMDRLGRPRSDIHAFTLPGFATGDAHQVLRHPAGQVARRDLRGARHHRRRASRCSSDLDHPFAEGEEVYDVTFENVQAGLRTDYLFRLANHRGGIVLGTGDLSELALGWCTYGVGDQMSHYNVNAGVPKTLIQHLIRWVVDTGQFDERDQRRAAARSSSRRSPPS